MKDKKFFFGLATLIGTIVGAGIFGIPYAISRSGVIPSLFYLIILGGAVLFLHLFFGEIVLRTKEKHRLVGYSKKYLGDWGKRLITISTIVGTVGTLLAYIIIGGDFLKIVFSFLAPSVGGMASLYFSLIFWAGLVCFIFRGIKLIAPTEFLTNSIFFLIIFLVIFFALPKIDVQNFILISLPDVFLPYGIILFALAGWTAIPEIGEILKTKKERKGYKKAIIISILAAISLYLVFSLAVVGISGKATSPDVFSGLIPFLGSEIIFFGALAAVITLADSFLVIGLYLKNTLIYDYKFPEFLAASVSCGLPLVLFLVGFRNFIEVIGFVGIIIGAFEGVAILLIFKKAKTLGDREPEYSLKVPPFLIYFLITIFVVGAISQIFYFIK